MSVPKEVAETHYGEHKEKPFFGELVDFITSGPVFAMVWQGEQVVDVTRQIIGKTNPKEALRNNKRRLWINCWQKHYPWLRLTRKCRKRNQPFL